MLVQIGRAFFLIFIFAINVELEWVNVVQNSTK